MKLIILPCAGGCAASFDKYVRLSDKIYAYEYPGHWTKYDEEVKDDPDDMIECLYNEILLGKYGNEVEILGHSMGGLLAWRLVNKLMGSNINVRRLYLAGSSVPQVCPDMIRKIQNDGDIKATLKRIRQVPEKVLDSSIFNDYFLPVIRNDFNVVKFISNSYKTEFNKRIPVSITCFCGKSDPLVGHSDMEKWRNYTTKDFNIIEFDGDHFFLYDMKNIVKILKIVDR